MPPKKIAASSRASTAKKVSKKTSTPLPKYKDLIVEAVLGLAERGGSSRQAIKKYIKDKYAVGSNFDGQFNLAVKRGLDAGDLSQPKGPAGSIKLLKKAVETKGGSVPVKKVTKKKVATVKKVIGGKKVATKKAVTKKPARASSAATKRAKVKKVSKPAAVVKKKVVSASTKAKKPTAAKKKTKKAIKSA